MHGIANKQLYPFSKNPGWDYIHRESFRESLHYCMRLAVFIKRLFSVLVNDTLVSLQSPVGAVCTVGLKGAVRTAKMTMSVPEKISGSGGKEEESEDESEILEESPCGRWQKRREQVTLSGFFHENAHVLSVLIALEMTVHGIWPT